MKKMKRFGCAALMMALLLALFAGCPNPANEKEDDIDGGSKWTWTIVEDSPFGDDVIYDVAYGEGTWVAVGDNGKMATSSDGMSWTKVTNEIFGSGPYSGITSVAYGNGTWVATGFYGMMATSDDNGKSWIAVTDSPFNNNASSKVAYGDGTWVVTTTFQTATSSDGKHWTIVSNPNGFIRGAAYGGRTWVTWGTDITTSGDGKSWSRVSDNIFSPDSISEIVCGNGTWVAMGWGKMATSGDCISWSNITNSVFDRYDYDSALAYGNGTWVSVWHAMMGGLTKIAISSNGRSWSIVTDNLYGTIGETLENFYVTNKVAYGDGTWVAVGTDGKIAYK